MAEEKRTREDCILLLCRMQERLCAAGEARYPRRSDFSEGEVVAIKAHLGPWPRALEAAGLKPPRDGDRAEKIREKRIQQKRRRTEARRLRKSEAAGTDAEADL